MLRVLRREGPGGLYRGVFGTLQAVGISYFVYFFLYNRCRGVLAHTLTGGGGADGAGHSAWGDLCASSVSGVLNVLLTCPLWVASVRLKLLPQGGAASPAALWRQLFAIAEAEGTGALWRGTASSLALVGNPVLQFTAYDALKRARLRLRRPQTRPPFSSTLSPAEALVLGGAAKALATVATYPLQVVQTLQRAPPRGAAPGPVFGLRRLARDRGARALFAGLEAKLLQTVLNAGLTFMLYEGILTACLRS